MQYTTHVSWQRRTPGFDVKSYDRTHQLKFGSGSSVQASSAPEFLGNASLPNPEELYTASIASCFMLTFLYWAALKALVIDEYNCEAVGTLAKNTEGKMCVTEVILRPRINFHEGKNPDSALLNELFTKAHENCFISNSVKTAVKVEAENAVA